jgi:hypothetical protein
MEIRWMPKSMPSPVAMAAVMDVAGAMSMPKAPMVA